MARKYDLKYWVMHPVARVSINIVYRKVSIYYIDENMNQAGESCRVFSTTPMPYMDLSLWPGGKQE
jgi:hypothetical protein